MSGSVKRLRLLVLVAFLTSIRPQLASAILLATETFHRIRIDLFGSIPVRVVIECQLGIGRDVPNGKEGKVVKPLIRKAINRNGDNLAIGIAGVVDKSCRSAELLAVNDVAILVRLIVIINQPVQAEEVRGLILIRRLAGIGVFFRDHLAEVTIDKLASDQRL